MEDKKIYDALDKAEKIAKKLARINQFLRINRKIRQNKDKKLGRFNKKTGVFVLKKAKKEKGARAHKRYKMPDK